MKHSTLRDDCTTFLLQERKTVTTHLTWQSVATTLHHTITSHPLHSEQHQPHYSRAILTLVHPPRLSNSNNRSYPPLESTHFTTTTTTTSTTVGQIFCPVIFSFLPRIFTKLQQSYSSCVSSGLRVYHLFCRWANYAKIGALIQGLWYILSLLTSTWVGMCAYFVKPLQVPRYVHLKCT